MNCINCGSSLRDDDQEFCPHCGFNIKVQRKVEYLSKYYYNQGLEKASIRDLSGAISCLKQSLTFNKNNIFVFKDGGRFAFPAQLGGIAEQDGIEAKEQEGDQHRRGVGVKRNGRRGARPAARFKSYRRRRKTAWI